MPAVMNMLTLSYIHLLNYLAAAIDAEVSVRVLHAFRGVVGGRALRVGASRAAPGAKQVACCLGRFQELAACAYKVVHH